MKRRNFVGLTIASAGAGVLFAFGQSSSIKKYQQIELGDLENKTKDAKAITTEERKLRIKKAQQLLQKNEIHALIIEPSTNLNYFTGLKWWPSERTMVAIIPAVGEVSYVCPAFEEDRFRELIQIGKEVFIWQEDESPSKQIAKALKKYGYSNGKIAIEENTRFFIADDLKKAAPDYHYICGNSITTPCRKIKSAAEIALMQLASDITVDAIKVGMRSLKEGMSPNDVSNIIAKAHEKMGANHDFALVTFGEASAFPHGTTKPQYLKKGDVVLMDCGCTVKGYSSDITKTIVFGTPTARQTEIWNLEQQAQLAGFNAAKIGATCESVDFAARKVIVDAGFGPGYKIPGLPHRTGHGIGMNGHEHCYIVKGNKELLQTGMCFSIEPTISIIGEFGIRLEDCVYMTDEGPKWFSNPSPAINEPFKGFIV